jgi:phosphorylase kinase alpha/beta subunit
MGKQVISDCEQHLRGDIGFRRYVGDSYWAPDYDLKLSPQDWTRDFSNDLAVRDALLSGPGQEAQWCIFDSIISTHFGKRYQQGRDEGDRERQAEYLNRALRQITGDDQTPSWRCPELYYLRRGAYAPNPHVPLQWGQANLLMALCAMRATAKDVDSRR